MLTFAQLSTIDRQLREINLLTNEELIQELTDHFTAAITDEMERFGLSFDTALLLVQQSFGDRNELQKMERDYNKVTFSHYDARWKEAVQLHFQRPLLWKLTIPVFAALLLASYAAYAPKTDNSTTWENFSGGFVAGLLSGVLLLFLSTGGKYLVNVVRRGFHNVPTETLYLLTRHATLTALIYGTGLLSYHWLLPLFPMPIQPVLIATYLTIYGLYIRTSQQVYATLFDIYSTR